MRRILTVVATALLMSSQALAGEDEALTRQQAHDLARVWMQLHGDLVAIGGLSEGDATNLAEQIDLYLELNGRREHLRAMLREAKGSGCKQECVAEAFKAMTRAMESGMRDQAAGKLVADALHEQSGQGLTNKQFAEQLRDRTHKQLAARARDQKQGVGGAGSEGQ